MSSVLCGVRMAVVSALALRTVNSGGARFKTPPSASDVLGFTHAFPLVSSSDDVGTYTTEQAVTSLHTFLTIFPHGKVGANITSLSLPPKGFHRQKIVPMNCTRIKGPHLGLRPSYERTGCTSTYALSVGFACSHSAPSTGRTAVHALLAVGFTGPTTPTLTPCRPPTAHPRSPIGEHRSCLRHAHMLTPLGSDHNSLACPSPSTSFGCRCGVLSKQRGEEVKVPMCRCRATMSPLRRQGASAVEF
eukprot:scaffold69055_cov35-Tisochrysis_lutea.AAC.2